MDELLKQFDLKWEDLDTPGHSGEKDVLLQQLDALKHNEITPEKIREVIHTMRTTLERELIKTPETEKVWFFFERPNRVAILIKARLQNCIDLEDLFAGYDKAKASIYQSLTNIRKSKVNY